MIRDIVRCMDCGHQESAVDLVARVSRLFEQDKAINDSIVLVRGDVASVVKRPTVWGGSITRDSALLSVCPDCGGVGFMPYSEFKKFKARVAKNIEELI